MKGKGKGKEMQERECPLQFPDFCLIDKTKICPRITSVLGRTEDEGVGLEDLDVLQLELETLLTSVAKRKQLLQGEMQILINHEKKDKKFTGKGQPEPPLKRGKSSSDDRPTKKFKDSPVSKPSHSTPVATPRPAKNKNMQIKETDVTDSNELPRKIPKNDAPNRFWNSVEPYCADITSESIKFLEDLVAQHEDDSDYHKIPTLGKHYSLKWAQEDMIEEQKEGNKIDKKKGLTNGTNYNSESEKLLKKVDKECDSDDNAPYAALTQRLVSCLMEENLITASEDIMIDSTAKDSNESNTNGVKGGFIKSLNITNTSTLERRIRKELEEQGILEVDDHQSSNSDDEVLAELKKRQAELKAINKHNLDKTKSLLKQAKELQSKQELKQKLGVADAEIRDVFRKLQSIRQKKKIPTKKEKDQAWRALKERSNILKLLENEK